MEEPNPYQSPVSSQELSPEVPGMWLVRVSTPLAICLEVVPIEADILGVLWSGGAFQLALLVKLTCLTAILLPLVIYALLYGPRALGLVRKRVAVVAVIVTIHLALFVRLLSSQS